MSFAEHFSIRNIPYGIATSRLHPQKAVATRVDSHVVFLKDLHIECSGEIKQTFDRPTLNELAALPKTELRELRAALQEVLSDPSVISKHGVPVDQTELHMPVQTMGFADYSCSMEHLGNASEAMTGKRSMPPAALHFPIGYNGRPSSVVVSGTPIVRPWGLHFGSTGSIGSPGVIFGPTQALDFELEMAAVIGKPSRLGTRISVEDADDHIFGLVLLNDWSARDIQKLEMMPLGPMNGKSFFTSISPWVITLEALEPFATAPPPKQGPVASYLQDAKKDSSYNISLGVEVVRNGGTSFQCQTQLRGMYWTFRDLVAQQTINGCNLNTGDLIATGTVSGLGDGEHGCLLEMAVVRKKSGKPTGREEVIWLNDGDETRFTGYCGEGVGFGDCTGIIVPARDEQRQGASASEASSAVRL